MDSTTLARVKLTLRIDSADTDDDTHLSLLIVDASAQVEQFLRHTFLIATQTEYHDVEDGRQLSLFLRSKPTTTTVTSLTHDSTGQFDGDDETAYTADDYIVNSTTGELRFRGVPPIGFRAWKVVYQGGLAASTAALITAYPLIARATDLQVAALYHRESDPQSETRSLGGAAVKHSETMGLCAAARSTCSVHRHLRFQP
jgi:hypothetical protein